jgi:NAD(P)-dependent dehydrogenase (short-subunit alcohol dehydrogenase family)
MTDWTGGDAVIVGAGTRLARVPVDPPRGDAIQQFDALEVPIVELTDRAGRRGVGFGYRIPQAMKIKQVVVITGASAGVGRATVRAFARQGADIGLLARGPDGLNAARSEVEAAGGRAIAIPTDVARAEEIEAAAERIERELGPIDIWVNNAMVSVFSPVKELTAEDVQRVTEVTYLGVVYGTLAALKRMLPRNRGSIVQVGSALAYRGIPLQAAYCGAKHAIQGFTESLRCELLHDGSRVHVSMVHLPAMNTPQFDWVKSRLPREPQPVPPIYQPELAANAIVWASSHHRREISVGGPTLGAIWIDKIASGLLDRYLARTGYDAQQTDQPADPNRPDNLWDPLPGDHGPHGRFGDRATDSSVQAWLNEHLQVVAGAVMVAGALAALAWPRHI